MRKVYETKNYFSSRKLPVGTAVYSDTFVKNRNSELVTSNYVVNNLIMNDLHSIWMQFEKIIGVNENGEIIADGKTVYGEKHAILLVPKDN